MHIPLKLGLIEQEHLQELYEAAGVPRDDLPYSDTLAKVCREFQDRTFKNASEAQVFGALLKYVRSGRRAPAAGSEKEAVPPARQEHARLLRAQRPAGVKLEPYTPAFDSARSAFARDGGPDLPPQEFWRVVRLAGTRTATSKRTPQTVQ
jgi:hypothetical protein